MTCPLDHRWIGCGPKIAGSCGNHESQIRHFGSETIVSSRRGTFKCCSFQNYSVRTCLWSNFGVQEEQRFSAMYQTLSGLRVFSGHEGTNIGTQSMKFKHCKNCIFCPLQPQCRSKGGAYLDPLFKSVTNLKANLIKHHKNCRMVYFLWSLTHLVANQSIKMALKPKQGGSGDYGPK